MDDDKAQTLAKLLEIFRKDRVLPRIVDTSLMAGYTFLTLLSILGVAGIVGCVFLFKMTSHPEVQKPSYKVHLAFIAVVDCLNLILTTADSIALRLGVKAEGLANNVLLCKAVSELRLFGGSLSPWGLVGLSLDRFLNIVVLQWKTSRTGATLMCTTYSFVLFFVSLPYSMAFIIMYNNGKRYCMEDHSHSYYFYANCALTGIIPCTVTLYLSLHSLGVIYSSCSGRTDEQRNEAKTTSVPLLVLLIVSALLYIPRSIHELLLGHFNRIVTDDNKQSSETLKMLTRATESVALLSCVGLGIKSALLVVSSKLYRRLIKESLKKPPGRSHVTVALSDTGRRVLQAMADGTIVDCLTGDTVDMEQIHRSASSRRPDREPSVNSRQCSFLSNDTDITEDDNINNEVEKAKGAMELKKLDQTVGKMEVVEEGEGERERGEDGGKGGFS